jgi:hypothetical protein
LAAGWKQASIVCPLPGPGFERVQDGHKLAFVAPGELRRLIV